jgi:hypothetical protein
VQPFLGALPIATLCAPMMKRMRQGPQDSPFFFSVFFIFFFLLFLIKLRYLGEYCPGTGRGISAVPGLPSAPRNPSQTCSAPCFLRRHHPAPAGMEPARACAPSAWSPTFAKRPPRRRAALAPRGTAPRTPPWASRRVGAPRQAPPDLGRCFRCCPKAAAAAPTLARFEAREVLPHEARRAAPPRPIRWKVR